jgi:hypothetical protein
MAASTWSTTDKSANLTLTGANLIATSAGPNATVKGKDPKRTGKYYIEYTSTTTQGATSRFGFATAASPHSTSTPASSIGPQSSSGAILIFDVFGTQSSFGTIGAAVTTGTLLCVALDLDNQLCWYRVGAGGNWNNNAANNPATGVGGAPVVTTGFGKGIDVYPYAFLVASPNSVTANFGGSAFTGAVPAGFTSGWDDSVSIVTNVVANQIAAEQWLSTDPEARLTQIAVEQWASVQSTTGQVVLSQILIEQWASVDLPVVPSQAVRVQVLA